MKLTLIISDNCAACERAKETIGKIKLSNPHLLIEIININFYNDNGNPPKNRDFRSTPTSRPYRVRISITPALLINNQLFSYGDIDESRLLAQLNPNFSLVPTCRDAFQADKPYNI